MPRASLFAVILSLLATAFIVACSESGQQRPRRDGATPDDDGKQEDVETQQDNTAGGTGDATAETGGSSEEDTDLDTGGEEADVDGDEDDEEDEEDDKEKDVDNDLDANLLSCVYAGGRNENQRKQEIQNCVNNDKVWNFKNDTCSNMKIASSFKCDLDGITGKLESHGLPDDFFDDRTDDGYKLAGCGENKEMNAVLWQLIKRPEPGDENPACFITTGCSRTFTDPEAAEKWQDKDLDAKIDACLEG